MNLLHYVNPLQGTYSTYHFSTGNSLPIMAMPYGMAHWTLQTDNAGGWFFNPLTPKLMGVRCTHQPSPWMNDYGAFMVMPQTGRRLLSCTKRATSYRIDKSTVKPHLLEVELIGSGTKLRATPTERGTVMHVEFLGREGRRIILEGVKGETAFIQVDANTIAGYTRGNSGGVPENFAHYFVARFDAEIVSVTTFKDNDPIEGLTGDAIGLCVEFAPDASEVTVRIATSFISQDQALLNLQREVEGRTFDQVMHSAKETWEELLGAIVIQDATETQLRTFYSCLYRTKLFPRIWHEVDASGRVVHFSPYDGQVHEGVMYADTGFWDTYRTQFPLMALLEPERFQDVLRGFVNAYRESGWLPQWPSPGHRVCMPGTHMDATIADAVARGLVDFDVEAALEGMVRHADNPVGDGPKGAGRDNIQEYLDHGYVLASSHASVSQSLDYAYDDWCIARVARHLGKSELAERLETRAQNYRKLWDPSVGFMRARHADGAFLEPFDQFDWGGPYCEGGPWQSSWAVQHDPSGLIELVGGPDAMVAKLDEMLALPPRFNIGGYWAEIHEMTEMAVADFGQYAHSNQPVHHVLFLYAFAGRLDRLEAEVHRVLNEYYTPDRYPGDEDNGEMAAWYVLCSLGMYPFCPGTGEMLRFRPMFEKFSIRV